MVHLCPQLDATWPEHACAAMQRQGRPSPKCFSQRVLGDADQWGAWCGSFPNEAQALQAVDESLRVLVALARHTPDLNFMQLVFAFRHEPLCRLYPEPPEHFIRMGECDLILDILQQGLGRPKAEPRPVKSGLCDLLNRA